MRFTADETNVKVTGRTLMRDGIRYLGYSCSAVEFKFNGTRAEAVIWSDSPAMDRIYQAWIAVFIDGEDKPAKRFPLEKEEDTYVLYESAEKKETLIKIVKYSEAAFGKVGIKSIAVEGEILPPPKESGRKLEFIGDSITCGYGNEGSLDIDVFNTAQENPWEAYAAITARVLSADCQLVSWSGIGIISNWTDQDTPNDGWLMPVLYPYTDKAADLALGNNKPEIWDNNRYVPDCIVINLGTNDNSYTKNQKEREETFGREYYHFVKQVRSRNPFSEILCTLGVLGQELCGEVERQVNLLRLEGDCQIHYMTFDLQNEKDGLGADWHPSKVTHEKMAKKLTGKLKELMNW